MSVVHPLIRGVVGQVMQQVSDVMQQGRDDQRRSRARLAGEMSRLKSVVTLADRFAAITRIAPTAKRSTTSSTSFCRVPTIERHLHHVFISAY